MFDSTYLELQYVTVTQQKHTQLAEKPRSP
jgi:hypothetical protein